MGKHVSVKHMGKNEFSIWPRGKFRNTAWERLRKLASECGIRLTYQSKIKACRCAEIVGQHLAGNKVPIPPEIKIEE